MMNDVYDGRGFESADRGGGREGGEMDLHAWCGGILALDIGGRRGGFCSYAQDRWKRGWRRRRVRKRGGGWGNWKGRSGGIARLRSYNNECFLIDRSIGSEVDEGFCYLLDRLSQSVSLLQAFHSDNVTSF